MLGCDAQLVECMFNMSRQAHLPPRCPFQKKTVARPTNDPVSPTLHKDTGSYSRHHKSVSQSYIIEEQPAWLDDLLDDSESNSNSILHRRSASDSLTMLDDLVPLTNLDKIYERHTSAAYESDESLESAIYGPNSPRRKGKLTFPENAIVSALSEYVSHKHLEHLDEAICVPGTAYQGSMEDTCASVGEVNPETKPIKRHPGQRSRVRKLQYIAELERTVDILQKVESDLASRVGSLFQQRLALSVENNKLKQKVIRLQQQKLFADGEYQSLKKEVERLKASLAYRSSDKAVRSNFRLNAASELTSSGANWQMLDMGKLDLN